MLRAITHLIFAEEAIQDLRAGSPAAVIHRARIQEIPDDEHSLPAMATRALLLHQPARMDPAELHAAIVGFVDHAPVIEGEGQEAVAQQLEAFVLGCIMEPAITELAQGLCQAGEPALQLSTDPPSEGSAPMWQARMMWQAPGGEQQRAAGAGYTRFTALQQLAREVLRWRRVKALEEIAGTLHEGHDQGATWRAISGAQEVLHPYDTSASAQALGFLDSIMLLPDALAQERLQDQAQRLMKWQPDGATFVDRVRAFVERLAQMEQPLTYSFTFEDRISAPLETLRASVVRLHCTMVARQIATTWAVAVPPTPTLQELMPLLMERAQLPDGEVELLRVGLPTTAQEITELARQMEEAVLIQAPDARLAIVELDAHLFLVRGKLELHSSSPRIWEALRFLPLMGWEDQATPLGVELLEEAQNLEQLLQRVPIARTILAPTLHAARRDVGAALLGMGLTLHGKGQELQQQALHQRHDEEDRQIGDLWKRRMERSPSLVDAAREEEIDRALEGAGLGFLTRQALGILDEPPAGGGAFFIKLPPNMSPEEGEQQGRELVETINKACAGLGLGDQAVSMLMRHTDGDEPPDLLDLRRASEGAVLDLGTVEQALQRLAGEGTLHTPMEHLILFATFKVPERLMREQIQEHVQACASCGEVVEKVRTTGVGELGHLRKLQMKLPAWMQEGWLHGHTDTLEIHMRQAVQIMRDIHHMPHGELLDVIQTSIGKAPPEFLELWRAWRERGPMALERCAYFRDETGAPRFGMIQEGGKVLQPCPDRVETMIMSDLGAHVPMCAAHQKRWDEQMHQISASITVGFTSEEEGTSTARADVRPVEGDVQAPAGTVATFTGPSATLVDDAPPLEEVPELPHQEDEGGPFVVRYTVEGHGQQHAGPYSTRVVAEEHLRDIAGYEGVSGAEIIPASLAVEEMKPLELLEAKPDTWVAFKGRPGGPTTFDPRLDADGPVKEVAPRIFTDDPEPSPTLLAVAQGIQGQPAHVVQQETHAVPDEKGRLFTVRVPAVPAHVDFKPEHDAEEVARMRELLSIGQPVTARQVEEPISFAPGAQHMAPGAEAPAEVASADEPTQELLVPDEDAVLMEEEHGEVEEEPHQEQPATIPWDERQELRLTPAIVEVLLQQLQPALPDPFAGQARSAKKKKERGGIARLEEGRVLLQIEGRRPPHLSMELEAFTATVLPLLQGQS